MTGSLRGEFEVGALNAIRKAKSPQELEVLRIQYLGRKSRLTETLRSVGNNPDLKTTELAAQANIAKKNIQEAITLRRSELEGSPDLATEQIDLTEPGERFPLGHLHPVTQVIEEIVDVFRGLGYSAVEGPEVEDDWHNFEALNIPPEHPARDLQATFYLAGGLVARTHTSSVQIRHLENHEPPVRIIAPGRAYRNEDEDASHAWIFHQVEGLAVDRGLSMADLRGTLEAMVRGVLGEEAKLRLRPSYFPYTEPSAEMDVTCPVCGGKGCSACDRSGWIELGGAGMVHPQVIRNCGYDPGEWRGFAFGFGPERLAMARFGIPDVRLFWQGDLRFLEQF